MAQPPPGGMDDRRMVSDRIPEITIAVVSVHSPPGSIALKSDTLDVIIVTSTAILFIGPSLPQTEVVDALKACAISRKCAMQVWTPKDRVRSTDLLGSGALDPDICLHSEITLSHGKHIALKAYTSWLVRPFIRKLSPSMRPSVLAWAINQAQGLRELYVCVVAIIGRDPTVVGRDPLLGSVCMDCFPEFKRTPVDIISGFPSIKRAIQQATRMCGHIYLLTRDLGGNSRIDQVESIIAACPVGKLTWLNEGEYDWPMTSNFSISAIPPGCTLSAKDAEDYSHCVEAATGFMFKPAGAQRRGTFNGGTGEGKGVTVGISDQAGGGGGRGAMPDDEDSSSSDDDDVEEEEEEDDTGEDVLPLAEKTRKRARNTRNAKSE